MDIVWCYLIETISWCMVKVHVNNEKMKQNGTLRPTISSECERAILVKGDKGGKSYGT